eukprot:15447195-Alexandrium_andersonii.AAC.1
MPTPPYAQGLLFAQSLRLAFASSQRLAPQLRCLVPVSFQLGFGHRIMLFLRKLVGSGGVEQFLLVFLPFRALR